MKGGLVYMNICTIVTGSITSAMKAQKVLTGSAIQSIVVKLDSSTTKHGCTYGLEINCNQLSNARTVLTNSKIRATYIDGGSQ